MGDRRFRRIHDRLAVHEGGRAEGGLAGQAAIDEQARLVRKAPRIAGRQFHEEIVRVLAIDQRRQSVGRLAAGEEQRIAARAHQRIGAQHRPDLDDAAVREAAPGHSHHHAGGETALVAARPALPVINKVEIGMGHDRPLARHQVEAVVARRVGLPRRAGGFASGVVRAERGRHRHGVRHRHFGRHGHPRHIVAGMGIGLFLRQSRGGDQGEERKKRAHQRLL